MEVEEAVEVEVMMGIATITAAHTRVCVGVDLATVVAAAVAAAVAAVAAAAVAAAATAVAAAAVGHSCNRVCKGATAALDTTCNTRRAICTCRDPRCSLRYQ